MKTLVFAFLLASSVLSLKCWNCVGKDCDTQGGPSWEVQECPEGAYCQTVSFEIYNKQLKKTITSSITRSCTYELGCRREKSSSSCRADVSDYGSGCTMRKCCAKDLCNFD